jgi:hypothetical protein
MPQAAAELVPPDPEPDPEPALELAVLAAVPIGSFADPAEDDSDAVDVDSPAPAAAPTRSFFEFTLPAPDRLSVL